MMLGYWIDLAEENPQPHFVGLHSHKLRERYPEHYEQPSWKTAAIDELWEEFKTNMNADSSSKASVSLSKAC